jgi:microcystin-dependent protein
MTVTIPQTRVTGDLITAAMYNELIAALEHILTLQVDSANLALANTGKALGWNIGDLKIASRAGDISNQWLRCDGRTIGNATSGATARANADMLSLYTHLWELTDNTTLGIQDSSGGASTRGANALSDFNANKRLPLLDLRGRVVAGLDPDDVQLAHTWSKIIGGAGGSEVHRLLTNEMPIHTHNSGAGTGFIASVASAGTAGLAAGSNVVGSSATASAGGGDDHPNVQPTMTLNYFIYTGL